MLDAMIALGAEPDPADRQIAAFVLGQLGYGQPAFPDEQAAALHAMAEREQDPEVLAAIACAFGHLGAPARQRLAARPRRRPGRRTSARRSPSRSAAAPAPRSWTR